MHFQVNTTAYIMYATPDDRGVPISHYAYTYQNRDDLAGAIRTGCYSKCPLPLCGRGQGVEYGDRRAACGGWGGWGVGGDLSGT